MFKINAYIRIILESYVADAYDLFSGELVIYLGILQVSHVELLFKTNLFTETTTSLVRKFTTIESYLEVYETYGGELKVN